MNLATPEDRTAAAGEYVLGTLAASDRAMFERAMAHDAALRAEVYAWQDRLLGLTRQFAPLDPPSTLWQRIEGALGGAGAPSNVTAFPPKAQAEVGTRRQVRLWQSISGLALAASLALATLLLMRGGPLLPGQEGNARYLAVLQSPDRSTGWIVEVTAGDRVRLVPVGETAPPPAGKALQFWTKPLGATGPTSLGLVRAGQVTELPVSRLPAIGEKQLFELTLEPETGSPIGRPTGPVLYVGSTVRL